MSFIDPHTSAVSRADARSYEELRAKWSDWLYKLTQRSGDDAEAARLALVDAIAAHHTNARALADHVIPRLHRSIAQRILSRDEQEGRDEQRRQQQSRRAARGIAPDETIV